MMLSLSNSLSRTRYGILDADAAAYVAAVESALGSSITFTQRRAIDTFIKGEKAASRYTLLKRLYLPIWGQAAANAIDMISLTSGTFNGTVTHAAGYVQGNGSTGYFNAGTPAAAGISGASRMIFDIMLTDTSVLHGMQNGAFDGFYLLDLGATAYGSAASAASEVSGALAGAPGVLLMSQTITSARGLYCRKTAGFSTLGSNATLDATALPNFSMFFAGAFNNNGSAANFNNVQSGAFGCGEGLDSSGATSFTLALKTLWETTTGLVLP